MEPCNQLRAQTNELGPPGFFFGFIDTGFAVWTREHHKNELQSPPTTTSPSTSSCSSTGQGEKIKGVGKDSTDKGKKDQSGGEKGEKMG